jgi:hypothetical protein
VIDVAVSRRMGLFVVGRLAARHGIKVRLRRAQSGGLSALIWVPETVAETEPTPVGSRRRFNTGGSPVVITSPAPTAAVGRSLTTGAHTVKQRPRSIWFDTGEDDPNPAPNAEPVHAAAVAVAVADPPVMPEPAPAEDPVQDATSPVRLPIFDSVESEWFRRGNTSFADSSGTPAGSSWTSPADEGFRRAAETIGSPVAGQTTNAGLPKRVPSANLVPGSISARGPRQPVAQGPSSPAGGPVRSPDAVRARLTGFQVRGREGRTDGTGPGADER